MTTGSLAGVRFIIDTNVISEITKAEADRNVIAWFDRHGFSRLAIAAPTVLELRYGLEAMPAGRKRDLLESNLSEFIDVFLGGRVIAFSRTEADACGRILAKKRTLGESLDDHLADAMIAACALTSDLAIATRNDREFRNTGVRTVNPWSPKRSRA